MSHTASPNEKEPLLIASNKENIASDEKKTVVSPIPEGKDPISPTKPPSPPVLDLSWNRYVDDINTICTKIKDLGSGAYGEVYLGTHTIHGEVAVKRVPFDDSNRDGTEETTEARLLKMVRHRHIVSVYDYVRTKTHSYLIMESMEMDLSKLMIAQAILTPRHVQYIMQQLISGMSYLHRNRVIHRDLKPSNILINTNCQVKICDFGLATRLPVGIVGTLTDQEYVTRWYRAPELLLRASEHSAAVDMWALGCIFAEMLTGRQITQKKSVYDPLFKGADETDQLYKIFHQLGTPTPLAWPGLSGTKGAQWVKEQPHRPARPWSHFFHGAVSPEALDLLKQLLSYNPDARITAKKALRHPYIKPPTTAQGK